MTHERKQRRELKLKKRRALATRKAVKRFMRMAEKKMKELKELQRLVSLPPDSTPAESD